jgi:hypothetical protein
MAGSAGCSRCKLGPIGVEPGDQIDRPDRWRFFDHWIDVGIRLVQGRRRMEVALGRGVNALWTLGDVIS